MLKSTYNISLNDLNFKNKKYGHLPFKNPVYATAPGSVYPRVYRANGARYFCIAQDSFIFRQMTRFCK